MWNNKKQQQICFPLCQTYKPTIILNLISKMWTNIQGASNLSTAPNAEGTISCKAWNSPVKYPSREWKETCPIQYSRRMSSYKYNNLPHVKDTSIYTIL